MDIDNSLILNCYNYLCTADLESAGDYFFLQAKHIMGISRDFSRGPINFLSLNCPEYSMGNFWVKKVKAPSKNHKKFPIICFAPDKKNHLQDFQNQRYIGIFMSLKERGGQRESESERERERVRVRARKRKGKREREQKCRRFYL